MLKVKSGSYHNIAYLYNQTNVPFKYQLPAGQKFRGNHSISNGFPDKCVLRFTQKFKMATKKWRESDFCKMLPVHSADILQVQNFVEIALSCTVSEINALLRFTQKFKMAAISGGKAIFWRKVASRLCTYPAAQKSLYLERFPR